MRQALKIGKQDVDVKVENALLKRALGYDYEETKIITSAAGNERIETTIRHVKPEVIAQIFWLKNRKRAEWRDKQEITHSGVVVNPYAELTTDELRKLVQDVEEDN